MKLEINNYLMEMLTTKKVPPIRQFIQKSSLVVQTKSGLQQLRVKQNANSEEIKQGRKNYFEKAVNELNTKKVELEVSLNPEQVKIKPVKNKFIIIGKIIDKNTKVGIPGLTISFFGRVQKKVTLLAEIRTDENGFFIKEFYKIQIDGIIESKLSILYKITNDKGKLVFESKTGFSPELEKVELINQAVDGSQIPDELKMGTINKRKVEVEVLKLNLQKDLFYNRNIIRSV